MRTTVDLPEPVHRRAAEIAASRGQSLSATVAELTIRGMNQIDSPVAVTIDDRSGFPTISVGRRVTASEVDDLLDDE